MQPYNRNHPGTPLCLFSPVSCVLHYAHNIVILTDTIIERQLSQTMIPWFSASLIGMCSSCNLIAAINTETSELPSNKALNP